MPLTACPYCSQELNCPDELMGKTVECPSCHKRFDLVFEDDGAAEEPAPPSRSRGTRSRSSRPGRSRSRSRGRSSRSSYDDDEEVEEKTGTSGLAVTSLVLGIVGLVLCLGPLAAIPAILCGHLAFSKIRASRGSLGGAGLAMGGLIIGYVTLLLTIIAALVALMAAPKIKEAITARQKNACINNMRCIDSAKEQSAMANRLTEGDAVTEAQIAEFLMGNVVPTCPQGGTYSLQRIGQDPTCSIHGPLSSATMESQFE